MYYKIPLKKIDKLFNPFKEVTSFCYGREEDIQHLLEKNDIFNEGLVHSKLKILAYEIANYEPEQISIYLEEDNFTDIEEIIKEGLYNLYSAFYLKKEEIIVEINGEEKIIEYLLGKDISSYQIEEGLEKKKPIQKISYVIDNKVLLEETWGNIEFVYNKLKNGIKTPDSKNEMFRFIVPELWENKEFLNLIVKDRELLKKSFNYMFNDTFFEMVKEDLTKFNAFWEVVLYHRKNRINEMSLEKYEESTSIYNNLKLLDMNDLSLEDKKLLDDSKSNIFYYNIKTQLLENEDIAYQLLATQNKWVDGIYEILPQSIKFSPEVLDLIIEKNMEIYPHYYLEKEQYSDYNFVKNYLTKYASKTGFEKLSSISKIGGQIKEFDNLLFSWKENKERVLDLLNTITEIKFARVYNLLENNLKEDKDIIHTVLNKDINLYLEVPVNLRKKYKEQFILHGEEKIINNSKFQLSEILEIENRNLLIELLKKGNVKWLKNNDCPLKWKQDSQLLNYIDSANDFVEVTPENPLYNTMINNKDFLKKIIKSQWKFFDNLPKEYREDSEILSIMAEQHKYIPPQSFSSKKNCLALLEKDGGLIKKVPQQYWYEKDFVIEIASMVDKKILQPVIFQSGPKEVLQLLNAFGVTENYNEFLSTYFLHQKLENNIEDKKVIKKKKV